MRKAEMLKYYNNFIPVWNHVPLGTNLVCCADQPLLRIVVAPRPLLSGLVLGSDRLDLARWSSRPTFGTDQGG